VDAVNEMHSAAKLQPRELATKNTARRSCKRKDEPRKTRKDTKKREGQQEATDETQMKHRLARIRGRDEASVISGIDTSDLARIDRNGAVVQDGSGIVQVAEIAWRC
jgi:hypothetical protein